MFTTPPQQLELAVLLDVERYNQRVRYAGIRAGTRLRRLHRVAKEGWPAIVAHHQLRALTRHKRHRAPVLEVHGRVVGPGYRTPVDPVSGVAVAARPPALGLWPEGASWGVPLEIALARSRVVKHPVVERVPVVAVVHPHEPAHMCAIIINTRTTSRQKRGGKGGLVCVACLNTWHVSREKEKERGRGRGGVGKRERESARAMERESQGGRG